MSLGLPSGLLWATMNIGASSPEEFGLYFSWGNVPGHAEASGFDFSREVYNETPAAAIEANLSLAEDMARLSLGSPWRMPTEQEFQELIDNCTRVWTTLQGVSGLLFTSNINGNSVFFPAAGRYNGTTLDDRGTDAYYWSSSYLSSSGAYGLYFSETVINSSYSSNRWYGFTARAVFKP